MAPAAIGAPGERGRLAPGEHHERVLGQLGQEGIAQPGVEWGEELVGVNEQHAQAGGIGGGGVEELGHAARHDRHQCVGHRVDGAGIQGEHRYVARLAHENELGQQRRFANAAWPNHVQHVEGQLRGIERRCEQGELLAPANELALAHRAEAVGQACGHRGLLGGQAWLAYRLVDEITLILAPAYLAVNSATQQRMTRITRMVREICGDV